MNDPAQPDMEIAVILPCFNEAAAIGGVIAAFRAWLPTARIVVFDNNSTDGTVDEARRAGAEVGFVTAQGKGHVIRQAFARLDADVVGLTEIADSADDVNLVALAADAGYPEVAIGTVAFGADHNVMMTRRVVLDSAEHAADAVRVASRSPVGKVGSASRQSSGRRPLITRSSSSASIRTCSNVLFVTVYGAWGANAIDTRGWP